MIDLQAEIAARQKICSSATPGPWDASKEGARLLLADARHTQGILAKVVAREGAYDNGASIKGAALDSNFTFIAHARTGYPETLAALADAVAALEKMLAALQYADKNNCNDFLGTGSDGDAADREAREWENAIESGMLAGRAALAQIAGRLGHMGDGREGEG